jgi:hypothetical protein
MSEPAVELATGIPRGLFFDFSRRFEEDPNSVEQFSTTERARNSYALS